jgi:5-methylcytosine-specific restriction enzyme A
VADTRAQESFLKSGGSKLTKPVAPKKPKALSSTEKQRELEERWAYIRRCFMACHPFCAACGKSADEARLELDHVIPRARGGKYEPENGMLLCAGPGSCHERKTGAPFARRR